MKTNSINDSSVDNEEDQKKKEPIIEGKKENEEVLLEKKEISIKVEESFTEKKEDLFTFTLNEAKTKKQSECSFPIRLLGLNVYRWLTIIIHLIFLIIMISSAVMYIFRKGSHNYILLCFELHDSIYLPLSTNSFAFLLLLLIIACFLIFVTNTLIRNDYKLVYPFLNQLSIASTISLISYSTQFIIGVLYLRSSVTLIIDLVLSSISLLVLLFVYLTAKRKLYNRAKRIITESAYPSALLCLNCYVVAYLVFDLMTRTPGHLTQYTDLKFKMEITFNFVIFGIALIVLTIFKDIVFPLLLEIIEIGLIAKTKKNGETETVVTIFIILFLYAGVVFMIFKYRSKVFSFKDDTEKVMVNYEKE